MRLFLVLAAVPIIEIALFIEIGGWLGTWPTIGLVILTALVGSILLRSQGLKALADIQGRLSSGENPGRLLADGAMLLVAGVLLLTPGFFTDILGFLLLIPGFRDVLYRQMQSVMVTRMAAQRAAANNQHPPGGGQTVDGTWQDVTPDPDRRGVE